LPKKQNKMKNRKERKAEYWKAVFKNLIMKHYINPVYVGPISRVIKNCQAAIFPKEKVNLLPM
jgi:hypothetical protein